MSASASAAAAHSDNALGATDLSPTSQVNARIDAGLKRRGDAGLRAAGLTPTKAVRAVWELAARYKDDPQQLLDALYPDQAAQRRQVDAAKREQMLTIATEGPAIFMCGLQKMGIDPSNSFFNLPYEQLKDQAFEEKLREDGEYDEWQ